MLSLCKKIGIMWRLEILGVKISKVWVDVTHGVGNVEKPNIVWIIDDLRTNWELVHSTREVDDINPPWDDDFS